MRNLGQQTAQDVSVELGSEIQVDRLDGEPGDSVTLDRVLLIADGDETAIGRPVVDGASVSAEVVRQGRGDFTHQVGAHDLFRLFPGIRHLALEGLGRLDEATEHYCRSLETRPGSPAKGRLKALGRSCG